MKNKLELYFDSFIDGSNNPDENKINSDYWFVTKQTLSDYYLPFFIAKIVDSYQSYKANETFAKYYANSFKGDAEAYSLFPKQAGENTFRNAIIAEYLGLTKRETSQYADSEATPAYYKLSEYIKCHDDVEINKPLVDRQIEKICLNVISTSDKYKTVSDITIFPCIFLYKVLWELNEKYKDSTLFWEEFALFVMRAKSYSCVDEIINYIELYRSHSFSSEYDAVINSLLNHQSVSNIRYDSLIGSLNCIEYKSTKYFKISDGKDNFEYIKNTISIFESSEYFSCLDKNKLKEFMQSDKYFKGKIDNVPTSSVLSDEEFESLVKKEYDELDKLQQLAEKYGLAGNIEIKTRVRIPSVQDAFRDKLIQKHGQKCLMCDITNKDLLIASHIKDAAASNIYEKADFNNGLLLCANHDKLFDKSLISFSFIDGRIMISKSLTQEEREICMLDENYCLPQVVLTEKMQTDYLPWHNDEFVKKEKDR